MNLPSLLRLVASELRWLRLWKRVMFGAMVDDNGHLDRKAADGSGIFGVTVPTGPTGPTRLTGPILSATSSFKLQTKKAAVNSNTIMTHWNHRHLKTFCHAGQLISCSIGRRERNGELGICQNGSTWWTNFTGQFSSISYTTVGSASSRSKDPRAASSLESTGDNSTDTVLNGWKLAKRMARMIQPRVHLDPYRRQSNRMAGQVRSTRALLSAYRLIAWICEVECQVAIEYLYCLHRGMRICGPVGKCRKPKLSATVDAEQRYETEDPTMTEMRTNRERTVNCDGLCIYEVASTTARPASVMRPKHLLLTASQKL
ncbi:hypothetical protein KCU76_g96, partial [Aureobasidium melanogenum]